MTDTRDKAERPFAEVVEEFVSRLEGDIIENPIKLIIPDDIEQVPGMREYVDLLEDKINKQANKMLSNLLMYGTPEPKIITKQKLDE